MTAPFAFWYEGEKENGLIRELTPLECERLMGMPENWTAYGKIDYEKSIPEMSGRGPHRMAQKGYSKAEALAGLS